MTANPYAGIPLCGATYDGPSYPGEHGVTCCLPKGHDAGPPHGRARHLGQSKLRRDKPLSWYSAAQKAARRAEEAAR